MKRLRLNQHNRQPNHSSTPKPFRASALLVGIALLAVTAPGCGKEETPAATPAPSAPAQPTAPAPVQRQTYGSTPSPSAPVAPVQTMAPVKPTVPMTKPAGSSKPVPVVP